MRPHFSAGRGISSRAAEFPYFRGITRNLANFPRKTVVPTNKTGKEVIDCDLKSLHLDASDGLD